MIASPLAQPIAAAARRRAMLVPAGIVLAGAPFVFLAIGLIGASGGLLTWMSTWGTPIAFATGGMVCAARARLVAEDRRAWLALAVACGCWTAANLYYALVYAPDPAPIPSPMDLGYVSFPLAVLGGLVALAHARLGRVPRDVWLDAALATLVAGAGFSAVMFKLVTPDTGHLGATITTFLYPLEDVLVLSVLVGVGTMLGWSFGRGWLIVVGAITAIAVADGLVFTAVLAGSSTGGAWPNLGWTVGIALMALGAWQRPPSWAATPRAAQPLGLVAPGVLGIVAVLVLSLDHLLGLHPVASVFAAAALGVSLVRFHRAFGELRALADSRRLAHTDDLTGLPNRRALLVDLDAVVASGAARLVALYDLDGFKSFNDTYGHLDGDRLLGALAGRLARAVAPDGRAYRLGGDEFCVIALASEAGLAAIDRATAALTDAGPGWSVTSSVGVVELPAEAADTTDALRLADRRMYSQKDLRPSAARQQVSDALLKALGEQQPDLHVHVSDVTNLVRDVAEQLGMPVAAVSDAVRAAELHDVGKLAIPAEILDKPGPLDDDEWVVMRRHTIIGERMLSAAPALCAVAPLVRSSHERWDGNGYPDGLAGEDIPLGARIVAVCDAFDAMVSDRAYRRGMPVDDALAELQRCAGSQFDPAVVRAFLAIFAGHRAPSGAIAS